MKRKPNKPRSETESAYFLKLVMYLVIGAQWMFILDPNLTYQIPIPIGLLIGLGFTRHEHFKIDRKIEYALLLASTFIGFWGNIGLSVSIN